MSPQSGVEIPWIARVEMLGTHVEHVLACVRWTPAWCGYEPCTPRPPPFGPRVVAVFASRLSLVLPRPFDRLTALVSSPPPQTLAAFHVRACLAPCSTLVHYIHPLSNRGVSSDPVLRADRIVCRAVVAREGWPLGGLAFVHRLLSRVSW